MAEIEIRKNPLTPNRERKKKEVSVAPSGFSLCDPPLPAVLLVGCTVATKRVQIRSHDGFICKRQAPCEN